MLLLSLALGPATLSLQAQQQSLVIERSGETIVLEPYAPNIIRVTLSLQKDQATAAPGYGFVGTPSNVAWSSQQTNGDFVYRSLRMVVTVEGDHPSPPPPLTIVDISKFFNGSAPPAHITITTPEGKKLLEMSDWSMSVPNHKDGNAAVLNDRRPTDQEFFQVGADFVSPDDEHYYGLGQNHEGYLDHRGHTVQCWHNYTATAAPSVCVPFVVTNYGYGMIWDNPSKTTIEPGFNERTKWTSEVGNRVSFFVIAGGTTDEIYSGYRLLTGATPLMPKAAYGFVQCKQDLWRSRPARRRHLAGGDSRRSGGGCHQPPRRVTGRGRARSMPAIPRRVASRASPRPGRRCARSDAANPAR